MFTFSSKDWWKKFYPLSFFHLWKRSKQCSFKSLLRCIKGSANKKFQLQFMHNSMLILVFWALLNQNVFSINVRGSLKWYLHIFVIIEISQYHTWPESGSFWFSWNQMINLYHIHKNDFGITFQNAAKQNMHYLVLSAIEFDWVSVWW